MINLYTFFHFNLNFSSLEEKKINQVIKRSYTKLLSKIEECDFQVGIEASGFTLEKLKSNNLLVFNKLKKLVQNKKVELIGSGYHQIISPLNDFEINNHNIIYGKKIYEDLLNYSPKIYLINEQAFNTSTIELYYSNNINNIIIDNNITIEKLYIENTNKPNYILYKNKKINLIWSHTFLGQILQDYIYDKINFEEYESCLKKFNSSEQNYLCFYGSDAETFDFRMKRYDYEKDIDSLEYEKLFNVTHSLNENYFNFIDFDNLLRIKKVFLKYKFASSKYPYHVKKQEKYTIVRWLNSNLSGLYLNSIISNNKKVFKKFNIKQKKDFLFLTSSDLKTHTSNCKIKKAKIIIENLNLKKLEMNKFKIISKKKFNQVNINKLPMLKINNIEMRSFKRSDLVKFNISNNYYSLHTVITNLSQIEKYTDLNEKFLKNSDTRYQSRFQNTFINLEKLITYHKNKINFKINFKKMNIKKGYVRFPLTFLLRNVDKFYLKYDTGGKEDTKVIIKENIDYLSNKYEFQSVNQSLYSTTGIFVFEINKNKIIIKNNLNYSNIPILIQTYKSKNDILLRVYLSYLEVSDTKTQYIESVDINTDIILE